MVTNEERIAELEERLREIELERDERRGRNPFGVIRNVMQELVPSDVRRHMLAAQRENLLAMRAYLDRSISRTEDAAARITPVETSTVEHI